MTEKKQQHKKKRGKVQHIRGSPKKRKIFGKAVFSSESIPRKMLADVKNLITDKASELKRADQKKLFLANFPYLMFAYFFNKIALLFPGKRANHISTKTNRQKSCSDRKIDSCGNQ